MKILIVDDEPMNRKVLRTILAAEGHTVVEDEDGLSALQTLDREKVDAVISDILMPRMDGYRLCYEIRKNPSTNLIPFIAYTATYISPSDQKVALDFGADKFITKPAPSEVILKALYEAVDSRVSPTHLPPPDVLVMREYSEALVRKLEEKNHDLAAANEALAASEGHLRTILESAPECVKTINRDGRLVDINRAGLCMIEADSAEQLLGKSIDPLLVPEHRQFFHEVTEAVFRGESRIGEFEIVGLKGSRRWLETHAVPLRDAKGEILSSLHVTRDITESKRAEQVLRQNSLEGIRGRRAKVVKDLAIICALSVVVFVAAKLFGLFERFSQWVLTNEWAELDELVMVFVYLAFAFAFFSHRRWKELKAEVIGRRKAEEALRSLHGELEKRVQERTVDLSKSNEALRSEIANRKQAQEMVQVNVERLRALHEIETAIISTLDLGVVLDVLLEKMDLVLPYAATTVRLFNPGNGLLEPIACRNLNEKEWKAEAWRGGARLANVVFETSTPSIIRNAQLDPRVQDDEFYRKHRLVSYVGVPLIAKGKSLGVVGFYTKEEHEFTDDEVGFLNTLAGQAALAIDNAQLFQKNEASKQQLATTNQFLERANKVKDEFLSVMSHELRTPLSIITGYSTMLRGEQFGPLTKEQEQGLDVIQRNSKALFAVIDSIMNATNIEARSIIAEKGLVSPVELLNELQQVYGFPTGKNLRFEWNFSEALPLLWTDGSKLRQILTHLINNAIKFSDEGSIVISAEETIGPDDARDAQWIEFRVADSGIGIPPEERDKIFERFHQVDSSATRSFEGIGLGLYIVKSFTEMLNGRVLVSSEVGHGSTFTVRMPCKS